MSAAPILDESRDEPRVAPPAGRGRQNWPRIVARASALIIALGAAALLCLAALFVARELGAGGGSNSGPGQVSGSARSDGGPGTASVAGVPAGSGSGR